MQKFILTAFVVLFLGSAQAQSMAPEFYFRFGIGVNLLLPEISLAMELRESWGGIGLRGRYISIAIVYGYAIDAYLFFPLSSSWDVYVGGGYNNVSGGIAQPNQLIYGLLGVRLKQGFYFELMPGVRSGIQCSSPQPTVGQAKTTPCLDPTAYQNLGASFALGFSWRF
jgi:hypothetical protein